MQTNLDNFLNQVIGLKYGINPAKLRRRQSITKPGDLDEADQKNRSYFCSELIAKAFKELGIIENDKTSCTMFFPNHFDAKG